MYLTFLFDYSELEKLSNNISKFNQGSSIGLTGLLSLDPVLDKTPLYQQILQSYKWSYKVNKIISIFFLILYYKCFVLQGWYVLGRSFRRVLQTC